MKNFILNIVFVGMFFMICDYAFAGKSMTLDQCIETAEINNPSLLASKYNLESAGYDIKAARSDFLPSLSSSYSVTSLSSDYSKGPTETDYLDQTINAFNIKLTQILYAGSRIVSTYEKAKLLEQVAKAQKDLKALELAYYIETTFYKLMKAQEDVIMATEAVDRLAESKKSAEAFFQKELVPYVEVLRARVDLADAREQLEIAKNNQNRERMALFSLMDMPVDYDTEFIGRPYSILKEDPSFEAFMKIAIENRPDIKALEYQLDITKKEKKIALGKYLPMIRGEVGYYDQDRDYDALGISTSGRFDRDQRNGYWSTAISVSWDLFDGGKAWYGKERYRSEAKKIAALITEAKNTIDTGIRKALYSLSEAKQRIETSVEGLIAATEYYAQEKSRLDAELSTIPSLLDAHGRLTRAQSNKTRAILDYQLAKSELKLITGGIDF